MAPARVPWGVALDELLADGEWHDREEVLAHVAAAVPPGVAFRHGEHRRTIQYPGRRKRGDDSTSIAAGARDRARNILNSRVSNRTIERVGDRFRTARVPGPPGGKQAQP